MPDGALVEMPDQLTAEQASALQALLPKKPAGVAEDILTKAVPGGLVRGLLAGADMGTAGVKALGTPPAVYPRGIPGGELGVGKVDPGAGGYLSRVELPSITAERSGFVPRAETGPGRYAEEAIAGGTGAMTFPGSIIPKLAAGVGGGVGGEFASNMLEEKPWARVVGALLGGPLGYMGLQGGKLLNSLLVPGGRSTQTPSVMADVAKGTTPAEWDKMIATREAGKDLEVPIVGFQGLDRPSPLHTLQEKVTGQAPKLTAELAKQNPAAQKAANKFLGTLAPEMEPSAVATRAQGAAEGAIQKSIHFVTAATAPDYTIEVLKAPSQYVRAAAQNMVATTNESPAAREFLRKEVFAKLGATKEGYSVPEMKNTLNEAKKSLDELGKPGIASRGVDNHSAGLIRGALNDLETLVSAASANRPQGNAIMREMYERIVNPMQASLTGKIAGIEGVIDSKVPPTTRILGELNAPTVRAESIRKLASDMARGGDAQAFPALVRGTWEQNLEKAFAGAEGSPANAPAKFAAALRGTAEQTAKRENFRATVAEVARANGLTGRAIDESVVGAEKLMTVMEAAGRGKGGMGATPGTAGGTVENIVLRGGPGAASGAQLRVFGPISDFLNRKAYKEIAEYLSSPTGLEHLRELAKFDLSNYRLSGISGGVAGTATQATQR